MFMLQRNYQSQMADRVLGQLLEYVRSFANDVRERVALFSELSVDDEVCAQVLAKIGSFVEEMTTLLSRDVPATGPAEESQLKMTLVQLENLEETDTNSKLMIAFNRGVPGEADINLAFSDGSVVMRGGYAFASCAVYYGDSSPLNQAQSLEDTRSSFVAELRGVELVLQTSLTAGHTCLVVCLDNSASLVLALEASRFEFCSSAMLQHASRSSPQVRRILDSIYEISNQMELLGYLWVRGHSDEKDFFSVCNDLVDRQAQSQSREAAALFFSESGS